jgi:hypothetical protein
MSTPRPPTDIDSYLRRLTQPDPAVVQRVLAGALRDPIPDRRRPRRWLWAAATLAVVLGLAVGTWRWQVHSSPTPEELSLTITGSRALVMVERADGQRWVIAPASSDTERGNYVIVVER